ncbi:hypothetical protein BDZ89DRAFT_1062263 [Hymenopellis radicata]|nr:hypothetical protein BDZ89DRAFT_1062263 [Hymenopellis radicata]
MPVFVHGLRLALLFQNTFDTFKTLKVPPPSRSSRSNGQPSKNAMAKRKRDMKGCLAVWMVWCCLLVYERNIERLVSLFIPFYDEVKALLLLFFLFTRARGAEPIYLHVIRPLVKPYTATLDALLDVARMFGDILFVLASYPIRAIASWIPWAGLDGQFSSQRASSTFQPNHASFDTTSADPQLVDSRARGDDSRGSMFAESRTQGPQSRGCPAESSSSSLDPAMPSSAASLSATLQYQIWHPPASSYDDPDGVPSSGIQTVTHIESHDSVQEMHTEEWRKYPDFPSAYPPTPIAPTRNLPPFQLGEADEEEPSLPPVQVFDQSLLTSRVPLNPGLADSLSDNVNTFRVHSEISPKFDKTLRTPAPHFGTFASPSSVASPLSALNFASGLSSPTALSNTFSTTTTTADEQSSLATPMDTELSSSETIEPFNSPAAPPGRIRKRALPRSFSPEKKRKARTRMSPVKKRTVVKRPLIQPRVGAVPRRKAMRSQPTSTGPSEASSTTASDDDDDEGGDTASTSSSIGDQPVRPAVKKRKVFVPNATGKAAPLAVPTRSSSRLAATVRKQ